MQPGDEFVASKKLYGGSINQFNHSYKNFGWHVKWADADDPSTLRGGDHAKTKAIFVESIANPGGVIVDIDAQSRRSPSKAGIPLIVDNTMASPYLIQPVRARRRHHRAFGHQVPGRPRQLDRRRSSWTAARST